jgi:hypothetical protein
MLTKIASDTIPITMFYSAKSKLFTLHDINHKLDTIFLDFVDMT